MIEVQCDCNVGPRRLTSYPEVSDGVRVCGWCRVLFGADGERLEVEVADLVRVQQAAKEAFTWGAF